MLRETKGQTTIYGQSMSSILEAKCSAGQLADYTGVSPENLQNWLKRKLIMGHRTIEGGGVQGRHRQFTFFNVSEVSIAKALIDLKLNTADAFAAAWDYAHVSGGGMSFDLPNRIPGLPFHHDFGDTLFAVGSKRSFELPLNGPNSEKLYWTFRRHVGDDMLIVNASEVFRRVTRAMGHDFRMVLDDAYGG